MLSAIITIYVVSLVLFLPIFLLYTTRWTVDPSTNATTVVLSHRSHYPLHPDVPQHIIAIVTGVLMPLTILIVIVSSVLVVVKLGSARKMRKEMANSQSESRAGQSEAKITRMLLSVCFLFIILALPETIGTLANYFIPEFGPRRCYHNTFIVFYRFVSLASCMNSSVNFVAYVSLSGKFRTTLSQILRCSAVCSTDTSTPSARVSTLSVTHLTST